jgi:hypothetical protein
MKTLAPALHVRISLKFRPLLQPGVEPYPVDREQLASVFAAKNQGSDA